MSEVRLVMCRKLGKKLPGLTRPPYKNELGKRIYEEVSKEAWDMWIQDSVKYINTYRVDLTSPEGQKFMFDQCAVYFGLQGGKLAETAFVPRDGDGEGSDTSNTK
ncbi:MAG: oxidative damage protection protein [Polyangiaceae bacterium]|nr:oxidative damage protection protein [Polyangiaceae bacterium]